MLTVLECVLWRSWLFVITSNHSLLQHQVPFETLDPEQMNNTTLRYAKSVMQLEKGLPPNGVVPILKEKVEVMRERVSVGDICGCYSGVGRWI